MGSSRGGSFAEAVELIFELDDSRRAVAKVDNETLLGRGAKLMTVRQTEDEILAGAQ